MVAGVTKITRQFQVTIPSRIRKLAHLHEGDRISFEISESGEIVVKPIYVVPRDQAYYWTEKWQKGIRASEEALERGEFKVFDNISAAKRSISRGAKNSNS